MQIRFLQEVAVLWDTIYSFRVQYNRERFEAIAEDCEEDREALQLISLFDHIPTAALSPFFCYFKEKHCFMHQYLRDLLGDNLNALETVSMKLLYTKLQNYEEVAREILCYYFPSLDEKEAETYLSSPAKLVLLVRDSDVCSDTIKANLLAILLNPAKEIQNLCYELMKREQEVIRIYEKQANRITELSLRFTEEHVTELWGENTRNSIKLDEFTQFAACFCVLNQRLIYYSAHQKDSFVWILGKNYEKFQRLEMKETSSEDMFTIVSALAEKNRLAFLNYIYEHEGTTGKMLEREFDMTGPNVYYHLGYLGRAGLVKSETKGRNIEYSINRERFHEIKKYMEKYERKYQK